MAMMGTRGMTASCWTLVLLTTLLMTVMAALVVGQSRAQQQVVLEQGVAFTDSVRENSMSDNVYVFGPISPLLALRHLVISLTAMSGDPDLFIGVGFVPDQHNFTWYKNQSGFDVMYVEPSTPFYDEHATYYIRVYGYTSSSFAIVWYTTDNHTTFQDGIPQISVCRGSTYHYYKFRLQGASNFTVTVTPISGDPDIYASTGTQFPGKEVHQHTWSSNSLTYDMLDISTTVHDYVPDTWYYISIYCFGTDAQYVVRATHWHTCGMLPEGIPIAEDVETGKHIFFKYHLDVKRRLGFTLTPITSGGDPDLFASVEYQEPTIDHYTWSSRSSGIDAIFIETTDPNYANPPAYYYLGVYGFRASTFTLTAKTEGSSVQLTDGTALNDIATLQNPQFYRFYHGDPGANRICTLSLFSGTANMYVSASDSHPSPDKFDWKAESVGSSAYIYIPSPVTKGWYYIGVYALNTSANYSIKTGTDQEIQTLIAGEISFFNEVPQSYYRYFVFEINANGSQGVVVSMKPLTGDADLYMKVYPAGAIPVLPSKDDYQWRSTRVGSDTIHVEPTDLRCTGTCRYYIAVYGFTDTYFEIIAYTSTTVITLNDGIPTPGFVHGNMFTYYKYYMTSSGHLTFSLSTIQDIHGNADPDLYVSTKGLPTKLDYEWKSILFTDEFIDIPHANPGWYYIGVFGHIRNATFMLIASTEFQFLFEAEPTFDTVGFQQYRYFQVNMPTTATSALISVTLISGATELYISTNSAVKPTRASYDYAVHTWPGNVVLARNTDPQWRTSTAQWILGVYGFMPSDFTILFQTDILHGHLHLGLPVMGSAAPGLPIYYSHFVPGFMNNSAMEPLYVNLRVFEGSVLFYGSQSTPTPSAENHTFFASGSISQNIVLPTSQLHGGYLYFALMTELTLASVTYQLTLGSTSVPIFLTQAQPQEERMHASRYSHFKVLSSRFARDLIVETESCDVNDAPVVYISSNTTWFPNATHYDHMTSSRSWHTQRIEFFISNSSMVYFLSVLSGEFGNHYSIFASTTVDGRPRPSGNLTGKFDRETKHFSLTIPSAHGHMAPYFYRIFTNIVSDPIKWRQLANLETVCGVDRFGNLTGEVTVNSLQPQDANFSFYMEPSLVYVIAVLVEDGLGLESAYQPLVIVNGEPFVPPSGFDFPISVGLILIILNVIVIVGYFSIGVCVQFVRGARGVELIPNYALWRSLPGLIWDGVRFIFTCGRSKTTYTNLSETSVNTSGFDSQPALSSGDTAITPEHEETSQKVAPTRQDQSNYGAI